MNEARLQVTKADPEGRWVSERLLLRGWRAGAAKRMPDAVFETHDEHGAPERHAIEVELSRKPVDHLRDVIAEHSVRYDLVVYLCSTSIARWMERLGLTQEFPTLIVREITDSYRPMRAEAPSRRRQTPLSRKDLSLEEVSILDLISEQMAIPLDQLARFLGWDLKRASKLATRFVEGGLASRAKPLAQEPDWIWLAPPGADLSSTGLTAPKPKATALSKYRGINEVRLRQREELPDARWVSGRTLRKEAGKRGSLPSAVIEVNGQRHAIKVLLTCGRKLVLERQIEAYAAVYDQVVLHCAHRPLKLVDHVLGQRCWPNVVAHRIPNPIDTRSRIRYYPLAADVVVKRLHRVVWEGRVEPSRARSLMGYLLLKEADVPQGSRSAVERLKRECKELGLVSRQYAGPCAASLEPSVRDAVEQVVRRLRELVEAGELPPSRARTLAGYLLLSAFRVRQGRSRTKFEIRRDCRRFGLPLCLLDDASEGAPLPP